MTKVKLLEAARQKVDRATPEQLSSETEVAGVLREMDELARKNRVLPEVRTEADAIGPFLLELAGRRSPKGFIGLDTGFGHLNQVLNGLNQGLYVVAGPPGAGKTTLLKQLADQVAEHEGIPVLFVTYKQSADELRIKTLSRLSKVNSRDIQKGRTDEEVEDYPGGPTVTLWSKVEGAAAKYKTFGRHLRIVEGGHETTIDRIRLLARGKKVAAGAERVMVCCDYLQIMPVADPRAFGSTKDRTDHLVSELRRLARDLDSPVVVLGK